MSVAFWSETLHGADRVDVRPQPGYLLSLTQAAMVVTEDIQVPANTFVSVRAETVDIQGNRLQSVLGTLRPINNEQMSMSKYAIISIMIIMFPLVLVVIIVDIITIVTRNIHSDRLSSSLHAILMYICRYRVQSPCHCYLLGNREL
jgi:hypothetical protein